MDINKNSDLQIEIQFYDSDGIEIGVPPYDFIFEYYVSSSNKIMASQVNGELTNCYKSDGKLYAIFDSPNLDKGSLFCEKTYFVPDDHFPDRIHKIVSKSKLNYKIV